MHQIDSGWTSGIKMIELLDPSSWTGGAVGLKNGGALVTGILVQRRTSLHSIYVSGDEGLEYALLSSVRLGNDRELLPHVHQAVCRRTEQSIAQCLAIASHARFQSSGPCFLRALWPPDLA